MIRRRHPSPLELGAYFDGEPVEGVAEHVARCRKCRESLDELLQVRCAVRGELDLTDGSAQRRARWTVALIPVAAAVALLLAVATPPGGLPVTRVQNADDAALAPFAPPELPGPAEPEDGTAPASTTGENGTDGPSGPARDDRPGSSRVTTSGGRDDAADRPPTVVEANGVAAPDHGAPTSSGSGARSAAAAAVAPAGRPAPPPPGPLRLGVPVPTRGPSAGEGAEVLRAVRAVVDRVNQNGGVAGRQVTILTVPTHDKGDRAQALAKVDALVGGFGIDAPAGIPWIMPADVGAAGPDVAAAELGPEQAGAALAADLTSRGVERGAVGAVVATDQPEAGLAIGLARSRPVHTVEVGRKTSCDHEIVALRKREVVALALAVPPELARRCAAAAARMGWRPAGGLLLAPSAVYAHLERDLVTQGARSAVALSMPDADDPGAHRFRRDAPGCDSYRSLVSFAAAELALGAAAASNGEVSLAAIRGGQWRSDLYDVSGGQHTTARVVTVRFGRWASVGPARHPSPSPRRGVILPDPTRPIVALGEIRQVLTTGAAPPR